MNTRFQNHEKLLSVPFVVETCTYGAPFFICKMGMYRKKQTYFTLLSKVVVYGVVMKYNK